MTAYAIAEQIFTITLIEKFCFHETLFSDMNKEISYGT
jgi:hypothetical protein